jgi:hypothetical protein
VATISVKSTLTKTISGKICAQRGPRRC